MLIGKDYLLEENSKFLQKENTTVENLIWEADKLSVKSQSKLDNCELDKTFKEALSSKMNLEKRWRENVSKCFSLLCNTILAPPHICIPHIIYCFKVNVLWKSLKIRNLEPTVFEIFI